MSQARNDGGAAHGHDLTPNELSDLLTALTKAENLTIFRRFYRLNVLNLVTLQKQIQKLEKYFENRSTITHSERAESWAVLQPKLKEYNRALIEMAQLRNLLPPDPEDKDDLWELRNYATGLGFPPEAVSGWDSKLMEDFVVLRSGLGRRSPLNLWVKYIVALFKFEFCKTDKIAGMQRFFENMHEAQRPISKVTMEKKEALASRVIMALFGGIALIVPTIIMVKVEGVNTSLIVTSVAVLIFALILAFSATDSTGKDVLAATAAYAAVLVVFVGTSVEGGSGS